MEAHSREMHFRVIQTSWGLAIDLIAHLDEHPDPTATPVEDGLWLRFPATGVSAEDQAQAIAGLRARSQWLRRPCTLVIESILYTPTDYQPEAVRWALEAWLVEELRREDHLPAITFDRESNQYIADGG